jgi:hypothetical protein
VRKHSIDDHGRRRSSQVTYLDELASRIEEHVPAALLPDEDGRSLFRLYAVLALVKGRAVTAADVHNAWAAWMLARDPEHHSIRPFEELDSETQASDLPFVDAIRAAASGATDDRSP